MEESVFNLTIYLAATFAAALVTGGNTRGEGKGLGISKGKSFDAKGARGKTRCAKTKL